MNIFLFFDILYQYHGLSGLSSIIFNVIFGFLDIPGTVRAKLQESNRPQGTNFRNGFQSIEELAVYVRFHKTRGIGGT